MEENKPIGAKLGTNKYFIEDSELPIYLVYLGIEKDAIFQIQRGEKKSYGFDSKGISSWMTFEQLTVFTNGLSVMLDSLEPLSQVNNSTIPDKVELKVGNDEFYIKANTIQEYALIRDYLIQEYLPICNQWVAAKSIQNLTAERKRQYEENKLKERQDFLEGENEGEPKHDSKED